MRIFLIILGAVLSLGGFACGASGLAAYRSVESDGFVDGGGQMATETAALVISTAEFEEVHTKDAGTRSGKIRLRIRAERTDGGPVFIGIGSDEAVDSITSGGSFATVRDLEFGPFAYRSVSQGGTHALDKPTRALFAVAAAGEGEQSVEWPIEAGTWRAIIMNAEGSAGLDVQVHFGVKFPYLRGFAIAGMVIGLVLLASGALLLLAQLRPRRKLPALAEPTDWGDG